MDTPLRIYTKVLVGATLVLIFLGGQVKSHEAGAAVPDWPTTYGENMFLFAPSNWVGNIFHEHVHRLVAASVGFLCIILATWLTLVEKRGWVRTLGWVTLAAVILQGVLGGVTVLLHLPASVSTSHAVLAQTFLIFTIIIAYSQSKERKRREAVADRRSPAAGLALLFLGVVFVQLLLGALMRHTESGLAIPDFPAMGGQYMPWFTPATVETINAWRYDAGYVNNELLPPVTVGQIWIHFLHRLGAVAVLLTGIAMTALAYRTRRAFPKVWRTIVAIDTVVLVQIALGVATVLTKKTPLITSLHVAVGAALLGLSALLALRALPLSVRSFDQSPVHARADVATT